MKRLLLLLMVFLVATPALAFQSSKVRNVPGGRTMRLCVTDGAASGVCDNAAGLDMGANVEGFKTLAFVARGTNFTCLIYAGNSDTLNLVALSASDGDTIGGAALTESNRVIMFANAQFSSVWIDCSEDTGGDVDIQLNMGM